MSQITRTHKFPNGQRLEIAQGDLTAEVVDAIVNAANDHLAHGGGVAAAIVRAGGQIIQTESNRWVAEHGPIDAAHPAFTRAGKLPCKYVIHAVGPVWGQGSEDQLLGAAVLASLRLAEQLGLHSIAFPAISTGIFGFPLDRAAGVILESMRGYYLQNPNGPLEVIRLVLRDQAALRVCEGAFDHQFNQ